MMLLESIPFVCQECGDPFDALGGGICRSCRRLLCLRHFAFSERWPLWRAITVRRRQPLCRACADAAAPPPRRAS